MNTKKIKKNIEHLKKIKEIIDVSKFDVINKIQNEKKAADLFLKISMNSKNIIEFATQKYWINSSLIKNKKSKKTVWIFVSTKSKLFAASYLKQEKIIRNFFDRSNDLLITIGSPAIDFSRKINIKPFFEEKDINTSLKNMPSLIASISKGRGNPDIKFLSNNSFYQFNPINVIPINKFNIVSSERKINNKTKFYPSLQETLSSLEDAYLQNIVIALLRDAKYFFLKEKLMKHEESLKLIDEKILIKKQELRKLYRKAEMDDLLLVTQISKRGSND